MYDVGFGFKMNYETHAYGIEFEIENVLKKMK